MHVQKDSVDEKVYFKVELIAERMVGGKLSIKVLDTQYFNVPYKIDEASIGSKAKDNSSFISLIIAIAAFAGVAFAGIYLYFGVS